MGAGEVIFFIAFYRVAMRIKRQLRVYGLAVLVIREQGNS